MTAVDVRGIYHLRGTFDRGMTGDGVKGYLQVERDKKSPEALMGILWFLELAIAGKDHGMMRPDRVDDMHVTPAGAISFGLGPLKFTGFLSGNAITGRHSFERSGKKPFDGSWSAKRLEEGDPELDELKARLRKIGRSLS